MRATFDLPTALMKEIELRAVQLSKEVDDTVAELLRDGLATSPSPVANAPRPILKKNPQTGLLCVESTPDAPISRMNTDEIYRMIHKSQEEEDFERLGVSVRR